MLRWLFAFVLSGVTLAATAEAQTNVFGSVAGTWTADKSPYRVTGDIAVEIGSDLTIEAGVDVVFDVPVPFRVLGSLNVAGTPTDSVRFITGNVPYWNGFVFTNSAHASFEYARVTSTAPTTLIDGRYGGISISGMTTSLSLTNCSLSGNTAGPYLSEVYVGPARNGGGVMATSGASVTLQSCSIVGNRASGNGGGVYVGAGASATIEDCDFVGNHASGEGGAVMVDVGGNLSVVESRFDGNEADGTNVGIGISGGGAISIATSNHVSISGSVIANGFAYFGGGILSRGGGSLTIEDCEIRENTVAGNGGGLYATEIYEPFQVLITRSEFIGNQASPEEYSASTGIGGGIFVHGRSMDSDHAILKVTESVFRGNSATRLGGGLALYGSGFETAAAYFFRTEITENSAGEYGGGVYSTPIVVTMVQCTLAQNNVHAVPNGLYVDAQEGGYTSMDVRIEGSIVWDGLARSELVSGTMWVEYSDVRGGWPGSGVENVNTDPFFTASGAGGYDLREGSPLVDLGSPYYGDLDGSRADMGATGATAGHLEVPHAVLLTSTLTLTKATPGTIYVNNTGLTNLRVTGFMYSSGLTLLVSELPIVIAPGAVGEISVVSSLGGGYDLIVYISHNDAFAGTTVVDVVTQGGTTGIAMAVPEAVGFYLYQNAPNPFNPTTSIRFSGSGDVRMTIFNAAGQMIRNLFAGAVSSGSHEVVWDGTDDSGAPVGSGVYLCRLLSGEGQVAVRRMVLQR